MKLAPLFCLVTVSALLLTACQGTNKGAGSDGIQVVKKMATWAQVYDLNDQSAPSKELGKATFKYELKPEFKYKLVGSQTRGKGAKQVQSASIEIQSVSIVLKLHIDVHFPQRPPLELIMHERGHTRILEMVYDDAQDVAKSAAEKIVGRVYEGIGGTSAQAQQHALDLAANQLSQNYDAGTTALATRIMASFDEITEYGHNSKSVEGSVKQAVERHLTK